MRAPDGTAGRKSKCPLCGTVQIVPDHEEDLPTFNADDDLPTFGADLEDSPPPAPSQAGQIHCMDCKRPFPASAMVCPNCGWVNQQAMGGFMPTPAKPAGIVSDYAKAILYGCSNIKSLLLLVFFSIGLNFVLGILKGFFDWLIFMGPVGIGIRLLVELLCLIAFGGFFLRFYQDCLIGSIEGVDQAPGMPEFEFNRLFVAGFYGLGFLFVYVLPIITLPLLPLGLLAWGYGNDLRAFDLSWALKTAYRKPGELAKLWVFLLIWGAVGVIAVVLAVMLSGFILVAALGTTKTATDSFMMMIVATFVMGLFVGTLFHMFMMVLLRCVGTFGKHNQDVTASLPYETPVPVAAGYITGGVIVSSCLVIGIAVAGFFSITSAIGLDEMQALADNEEDVALVGWEEQPKYKHKEKQSDYLSLVMRGQDSGKNSASAQTLKNLGTTLKSYEAEKGKYPDTLNDLVDEGYVDRRMIFSEQNQSKPIVYHKPGYLASGDWVVAYDPIPQFGDMFAVFFNNGSVQTISYKELDAMLKNQGSPAVE